MGHGICHLFRQDVRKVGFIIAGNRMRYIFGTENFLILLFGKREKYEMIGWYWDKNFWRDLIKHKYDSFQEIGIQHPLLDSPIILWYNFSRELLNCHYFRGLLVENEILDWMTKRTIWDWENWKVFTGFWIWPFFIIKHFWKKANLQEFFSQVKSTFE